MTTEPRIVAKRKREAKAGFVRYEVYAHKDDRAKVKAYAEKLKKKRAEAAA